MLNPPTDVGTDMKPTAQTETCDSLIPLQHSKSCLFEVQGSLLRRHLAWFKGGYCNKSIQRSKTTNIQKEQRGENNRNYMDNKTRQ